MLVQHVDVDVLEGSQAAFEAALCEVRQRVFASPGFRGFSAAQDVERSSRYLVTVRWESLDELADFVDSGRFERCWAPAGPFLARPLRLDHVVERPHLTLQGPGVLTDMSWLRD
jgi:heme-degrading monooxygenase HmoA